MGDCEIRLGPLVQWEYVEFMETNNIIQTTQESCNTAS